MKVRVLPFKGKPLSEVRPAFFLKAFGEKVFDMRIFSFGRCNYACPYCKREGYDKDNLNIEGSVEINEEEIFEAVDEAISKGQVIRLSGGDPVCYPELSLRILKYAKERGGITSIAHNGSGPEFVEKLAPYLDFASIDFKAASFQQLGKIAGINKETARKCFANTIRTIKILQEKGIYTDVRTCVFDDTSYEQLMQIAELFQGEDKSNLFWTLRTYSQVDSFDKKAKTPQEMTEMGRKISERFKDLRIGIRAKWEPAGFQYFYGGEKVENLPTNKRRLHSNVPIYE